MKYWRKNRFARMRFSIALVILMTGIFYLFFRVIPVFSQQYPLPDNTQEGNMEMSVPPSSDEASGQEPSPKRETSTPSSDETSLPGIPSFNAPSSDSIPSPETEQSIDPDRPMVALTFDDGPGQGTTAILNLLEQYNARATFFVVGLCLEQPRQVEKMQRAYEMGNVIGSHTYDHKSFRKLDESEIREQMERTDKAILAALGVSASLVRPPYGHVTDDARNAASTPFIHWSLDTEDWLSRDASSVIEAVQENVQDGDIILMHDTYSSTAEACETLIPWLLEQGYQLVTVPELMEAKGIVMENGQMYKDAR